MPDPAPETPAAWRAPAPVPAGCRTARIALRVWTPQDAPAMRAALDVDRESFEPWLPWTASDNRTDEECLAAIERQREKRERVDPPADDFTLGIFDAATGEALGGTGLHRIVHAAHEGEIGYWMRADRRRQGLCSEAVAALITWAFAPQRDGGWGLRRLHIRCAGANHASRRVPESLGLTHEATLRQERWVRTRGWDDTIVFGVLRDEWRGKPGGFQILPG